MGKTEKLWIKRHDAWQEYSKCQEKVFFICAGAAVVNAAVLYYYYSRRLMTCIALEDIDMVCVFPHIKGYKGFAKFEGAETKVLDENADEVVVKLDNLPFKALSGRWDMDPLLISDEKNTYFNKIKSGSKIQLLGFMDQKVVRIEEISTEPVAKSQFILRKIKNYKFLIGLNIFALGSYLFYRGRKARYDDACDKYRDYIRRQLL